jgi:hypothetical protein
MGMATSSSILFDQSLTTRNAKLMDRQLLLTHAVLLIISLPSADSGAAAYRLLDDFVDDLDHGNMIEIGSDRGEGSTRWLAEFAAKTGRDFFTVDFSDEGYRNAQRACGSCAFKGMGESFLTGMLCFFSNPCCSPHSLIRLLKMYIPPYPTKRGLLLHVSSFADF